MVSNTTNNILIVDFPQPEEHNLIVEFPQDIESSSVDMNNVMRNVHFSLSSELCVYECLDDDRNKIWYSDNEYHSMRSEFKHTIQKMHQQYRCSLSQLDSMSVHNKNRVRAVLDEQERQDRAGVHNPDVLAEVSQRYSQWSRIRSKFHIERFL